MEIIEKAKVYAIKCHSETNHLYDGKPYSLHLQLVYAAAQRYIHLVEEEPLRTNVLAAAWTHDVIEDCRQTYNDVKNATCFEVAEITYALTNEKGRTRKERAGDKYYTGIRNTPGATFLKICDRMANVDYSLYVNSRMLDAYKKEFPDFLHQLHDPKYNEMFSTLEKSLK